MARTDTRGTGEVHWYKRLFQNHLPDFGYKHQQLLNLAGLLVLMGVVVAFQLTGMLARAWEAQGVSWWLVTTVSEAMNWGVQGFVMLMFGVFLSLSLLLVLDEMKRGQGVLLTLVMGIALVYLAVRGYIIPTEDTVPKFVRSLLENGGLFLVGCGFGVLMAGGRDVMEVIEELRDGPPWKFEGAIRSLSLLLFGFVVVGFIEAHVQYPTPFGPTAEHFGLQWTGLVKDAAASAVFFAATGQFLHYELDRDYLVLGPRRSGKSTFMAGAAYYSAMNTLSGVRPDMTKPMEKMYLSLDEADDGWGGDIDKPDMVGEFRRLKFTYRHGEYVKHDVTVQSVDYGGEHFDEYLVDYLEGELRDEPVFAGFVTGFKQLVGAAFSQLLPEDLSLAFRRRIDSFQNGESGSDDDGSDLPDIQEPTEHSEDTVQLDADVIPESDEDPIMDHIDAEPREIVLTLLEDTISKADTLLLLVDADYLIDKEIVERGKATKPTRKDFRMTCMSLLSLPQLKDKDVILLVTKADHLVESYQEETGNGDPADNDEDEARDLYKPFQQYVARLVENELKDIVNQSQPTDIIPVFYEIEEYEAGDTGNPKPKRPLNFVGVEQVLQRLGE